MSETMIKDLHADTMTQEFLKELNDLQENEMIELIDYMNYLKYRRNSTYSKIAKCANSQPKRCIGSLKDDFISIEQDFDSCFENLGELYN